MTGSLLARLGRLLVDAGQRLILRAERDPALPYPLTVGRRAIPTEARPGVAPFDTAEADAFNRARLDHLAGLGLALEGKSVLDAGCGVGHLSAFFAARGCRVTAVDAREENIAALRERLPAVDARVLDVERQPVSALGRFDVVLCYGLLYHLTDHYGALRNLAEACDGLLLLETVVCDHILPVSRLDDEFLSATEALHGVGQRPSPSAVVQLLTRAGFKFVFAPKEPPAHPQFRFAWRNSLDFRREGALMRCVFVASRKRLQNPKLADLLG